MPDYLRTWKEDNMLFPPSFGASRQTPENDEPAKRIGLHNMLESDELLE